MRSEQTCEGKGGVFIHFMHSLVNEFVEAMVRYNNLILS